MPELPEVETIVRGLHPRLAGREFVNVQVNWAGSLHEMSPARLRQQLIGRRVHRVTRRGKFLIFELSDDLYLLIHLRMTGQLLLRTTPPEDDRHIRLVFGFDDGSQLYFRDTRKFGRVYLARDPHDVVGSLGPEPLVDDFDLDSFAALLSRRRGMIKPLLLNQRFIAGLGNIYTDEALFGAGIHPRRRADTLELAEISHLYIAIRRVLQQGIANRGTTLDDFRDIKGQAGRNQQSLEVFRRAEEPCSRCGAPIQRTVIGGRGTYFCARCQK